MSRKFLQIAPGCCHVSTESSGFIGLECAEYWELSLNADNYFSIQKLRWRLQPDQSQRWRRASRAPARPAEPMEQTLNHGMEQHLWIRNTYHLKRQPLSLRTCAGFPGRLSPPFSPPELWGELAVHQGNPLGWLLFSMPPRRTRGQPKLLRAPRSSSDESSYSSSNAC